MDDRKPPDTNVVRLRRNGDPSDEERQRLARTIFAPQDEVGTFSRGNLVPPAPSAPPASNEPRAADPFFEQLQTSASDAKHHPTDVSERDATAEYFDRLGSQTPAEMTQGISPHPAAPGLPGSASLPKDLMPTKRRRSRSQHGPPSPPRRSHSIRRVRVAAPPLLVVLGALVVAGAALAAIVGGGERGAPTPQRLASKRASAPSARDVARTTAADLMAALSRRSARHHTASKRTGSASSGGRSQPGVWRQRNTWTRSFTQWLAPSERRAPRDTNPRLSSAQRARGTRIRVLATRAGRRLVRRAQPAGWQRRHPPATDRRGH